MVDERVRVANVSGHGVRPYVLNAHRLDAFRMVSIAGNPSVGVVALSFRQLTRPLASPGACGGPRHIHRWRRWPLVRGAGHYLGRIVHQSSAPTVKGRLGIGGGSMS